MPAKGCNQKPFPWISEEEANFELFHELMSRKIREILLILSSYDAFIMEENASLATLLVNEYQGLNLSHPPRLTRVSNADEALEIVRHRKFDLVITTPQIDAMDCNSLARQLKDIDPRLKVILLAHSMRSVLKPTEHNAMLGIDHLFVWTANPALLLAIVKNVEDHLNVEKDTELAMVRVLILVEDSPLYRSHFLPLVYREVVRQTQAVLDESFNEEHRLLKMRARPKILVAENFEFAMDLYHCYQPYVFGIISDTRFPVAGKLNNDAGILLLGHIRKEIPDLPLLLLSSESGNRERAERIPAVFLDKNSKHLESELHGFFLQHLGFGDFIFRTPDGKAVERAGNLHDFEKKLARIPDESLLFHASRNHFSNWTMARSEVGLASSLHRTQLAEITDPEELRRTIICNVHSLRKWRQQGVVTLFSAHDYDGEIVDFAKIGYGSMGGKALGLAFMAAQLKQNPKLHGKFPSVSLSIPRTLVITTDGFHSFVMGNDLFRLKASASDEEIAANFLAGEMPAWLTEQLLFFLSQNNAPLTVRSSSQLEDVQFVPYAGLFQTYMLPNNHRDFEIRFNQLLAGIKLVFASAFFSGPKSFSSIERLSSGEEGMAVIIQQLAGRQYGNYFYPVISGVAQSHNYYPYSHMQPGDGIAHIALGFGKTVVEGEQCLRFSPRHPAILPQFSSVEKTLRNAQRFFYALRTVDAPVELAFHRNANLDKREVCDAEEFPLQIAASTYDAAEERIRDSGGHGSRVLTFARILKHEILPLPQILTELLKLGRTGMGCGVEIEFAVDINDDSTGTFHLLQIRPMASGGRKSAIEISEAERRKAFCYSSHALGHGEYTKIADIIYVNPDTFDVAATREIASEIDRLNALLEKNKRPYLLIGPGRWGSADHWLGIPVQWRNISGVGAIVELRNRQLAADPSQGTHFFQNITSLGIPYLTVTETIEKAEDFIDWQWLSSQPVAHETGFLRHLRLTRPFTLRVDGTNSECVLFTV